MDAIALLLLLVYNTSLRTAAFEMETFSDSGWRPILSDRVNTLSLLNRNDWKNEMNAPEWLHSANNRDFIKEVQAPTVNKEYFKITETQQHRISSNNPETSLVLPINEEFKHKENRSRNDIPVRRGRKMEINSNYNLSNSFEDRHDNLINKDKDQENINVKAYKVIEDPNDENLLSSDQNAFISKDNYDLYEKDKMGNNYTNSLWNILSNYNIRSSDRLSNYALSLMQNSRNSNSGYAYMHVPIQIPVRLNSANHAPVDPLLAVFLSNYGHYVPGTFGFQQKYKNLYGYLASNNIHNNKPFGAYKIFADTDSSL